MRLRQHHPAVDPEPTLCRWGLILSERVLAAPTLVPEEEVVVMEASAAKADHKAAVAVEATAAMAVLVLTVAAVAAAMAERAELLPTAEAEAAVMA